MKTISLIFSFVILVTTLNIATAKEKYSEKKTTVLSSKMEVFYFKVHKPLQGGIMELYDASGNLILTENIVTSKMLIDFFEIPAGHYIVRLKRAGVLEEMFIEKD